MNRFIKGKLFHNFSKSACIAIFLLGALDMLSMTAPYYLKYVIPNIYNYMHIDQSTFDHIIATLGWIVLATQIPSGILADKLSSRRLLIVSGWMTAAGTLLWVLTMQINPSNRITLYYIAFITFGFSTTLFLWAPLWKVLSQQASKEKQGQAYGLEGTFNGLLGIIIVTTLGSIATYYAGLKPPNNNWFYLLVYILIGGLVATSLGIWLYVPETHIKSPLLLWLKSMFKKSNNKTRKNNPNNGEWLIKFKTIFKPFTILRVWLIAFFVLGMYSFQSTFAYYMNTYLEIIMGNGILLILIAGFRTYGLRMVVSSPFGKWAQKKKSFILVLIYTLSIGLIIAFIFILLPGILPNIHNISGSYRLFLKIVMPILFVLIGAFSWFLATLRFAQIDEIPVPKNSYGIVIGIISFIAFSSDAWFYQMAAWLMKTKPEYMSNNSYSLEGLQLLLIIALLISLISIFCGLFAYLISKRELKKLGKTDFRWRHKVVDKEKENNKTINLQDIKDPEVL